MILYLYPQGVANQFYLVFNLTFVHLSRIVLTNVCPNFSSPEVLKWLLQSCLVSSPCLLSGGKEIIPFSIRRAWILEKVFGYIVSDVLWQLVAILSIARFYIHKVYIELIYSVFFSGLCEASSFMFSPKLYILNLLYFLFFSDTISTLVTSSSGVSRSSEYLRWDLHVSE